MSKITSKEACEILGINRFQLHTERLLGLPHEKVTETFFLYSLEAVQRWAETRGSKKRRSEQPGRVEWDKEGLNGRATKD